MTNSQPQLQRNWILAALMLTMFLAAMDIAIISTVIPQIVEDIGGFEKFSWVFSIYLLTQTATIPIYGKLADLYGRKFILLLGIVLFLIGSAASAAAWDIYSLIVFRGIQGIGGGSIIAIASTIVGDIYTVAERAKIQGWLSSVWGISAILGPVIGGTLAENINWRWIFIINIPLGIIAIVMLAVHYKENVVKQKAHIDYLGALFISSLLGALIIFLLNGGQNWPWISIQSGIVFGIIILFTFLSIRAEKRAKSPILPGWVITNRTFLGSNLAVVGLGIAMMGPQTYLPTFMQASLGYGVIVSGLVLAAISIGWPTASALSGKLYLTIGFRNTQLIGATVVVITCIGFLFIPWPQNIFLLTINMIFLGAGFGLLSTPSIVGIQSVVGWEKRGVVTGSNQFGRYLGQSLGAAVFGAIFNGAYRKKITQSQHHISSNTENVLDTLHSSEVSQSAKHFIKEALNVANNHIFWGMIGFGILTLIAVWLLVPPKLHQFSNEELQD